MALDHSTILQVNATMIVGILIFFSFSSSLFGLSSNLSDFRRLNQTVQKEILEHYNAASMNDLEAQFEAEAEAESTLVQVTLTAIPIIPFTASSLLVTYYIRQNHSAENEKNTRINQYF